MKKLYSALTASMICFLVQADPFLVTYGKNPTIARTYDRKKLKTDVQLFVRTSGKKDKKVSKEQFHRLLFNVVKAVKKDIWVIPIDWEKDKDVFYCKLQFLIPKDANSEIDAETYDAESLQEFKKATGFAYVFSPHINFHTSHDSDNETA